MLCAAAGSSPLLPPKIHHPSAPAHGNPPQRPQDLATRRRIANPAALRLETQLLYGWKPSAHSRFVPERSIIKIFT